MQWSRLGKAQPTKKEKSGMVTSSCHHRGDHNGGQVAAPESPSEFQEEGLSRRPAMFTDLTDEPEVWYQAILEAFQAAADAGMPVESVEQLQ